MASLKEIKGRIASVKSTQKITSAMKMVSSAKLHKAQSRIESFLPYESRLTAMLDAFLASEAEFESPLSEVREVKHLAVVVLSSNSTLCGAFNANIVRLLNETLKQYNSQLCESVRIYPIGKKIEEAVKKLTVPVQIMGSYIPLMDKPDFEGAKAIADQLIVAFQKHNIDRVELLYNHFKSAGIQIPVSERFLPVDLAVKTSAPPIQTDYIIEPDKKELADSLIPKSLRSKIYAVLLDSAAAEQAARTVAMQIATDNANDILDELTIQYNKQRQQSITGELLDIVGGSEALK
ncbi:F-ATPase gamma subunit [Bacteroidales bacterium Barb4]|nr:F-ATPase gamma subunit [Bacteroidales bacterium Barb4]